MKEQNLSDFMNVDEFIKIIIKELEEKHKVYPSVNVWNFTLKTKKEYYTIKDIESVLKSFLQQSQAK